ncbi:hypothetical protein A2U01_0071790, partial [Trifolium medium]|nr:hypothetical protein [Trifolium medium]
GSPDVAWRGGGKDVASRRQLSHYILTYFATLSPGEQ